jgi:hypothetical protein
MEQDLMTPMSRIPLLSMRAYLLVCYFRVHFAMWIASSAEKSSSSCKSNDVDAVKAV